MNFKPAQWKLAMVLAVCTIAASLPAQTIFSNAMIQAHNLIETEMASKVPGLSVAVAVDGKLVWSEAFGYADLAAKKPATTGTRFRIGSVSKPLTSVGLALLVERGELDMDVPIQKYVPDFPQKEGVITPRLLAGHLSGIRNYRGSEAVSNKPYPHLRDGLKLFENDPLIAPPGTKYSYASYNWNLLGVAMESAAKQDFLSYMDDAVIKPLNLTNTRPDRAGTDDPQRTQFYETTTAGKFVIAPKVDLSYVWPAGGYLSTCEDLVRFGSAFFQPGFLTPASRRMLFTSQKTRDGKWTQYGVGWQIGRVAYHNGDSIGGTAILMIDFTSRTVVAILCNRGHLAFDTDQGKPKLAKLADGLVFKREKIALELIRLFAPSATNSVSTK